MVYQRTKRGRLKQVTRWLRHYWPTEKSVRLLLRGETKGDCYGNTHDAKKRIVVTLYGVDERGQRDLVHTLLHEWARARFPTGYESQVTGERCCAGALLFGKIYSEFVDHGGCEESLWF